MTNVGNTNIANVGENFLVPEIKNFIKFGYDDQLDKIETLAFLESSKKLVEFVDRMGKIFAPLKHDMNGNITKLTKKYLEDEVSYKYIDDMILSEKRVGKDVATDALQWLRRGLHFLARFFELIVQDAHNQDSLVPLIKIAYEEVLQRYHGWMGVQLFNIMCRFAPRRRDFFKIISPNNPDNEIEIITSMEIFKNHLLISISYLIDFYMKHDLETNTVV